MIKGSVITYFFVRMRRFFSTLDKIDILYLVYLCTNKILFKVPKQSLNYRLLILFHFGVNLNKPNVTYRSYPKSRKIDAFEQNKCNVTALQTNKMLQSFTRCLLV